ncbi:cold-inducible protein YdjO-related protein, partial [Priestia megaterium]
MYYYGKRNQEPLAQEQTEVWECTVEDCKGWMRKDFSYDNHQKCPLCGNHM